MAKGAGPMAGKKLPPAKGTNGPNDKNGGTKHYAPPKPAVGKGKMTGTKG